MLFVGKAQEKASVFRTEKRRDARGVYPWIIRSTAMVNHYYVYLVDKDFGPLFIQFCSDCRARASVSRGCPQRGSASGNSPASAVGRP